MINIHEKLWVIKGYKSTVEDSDQLLAYMTHVETNKTTGEPSPSFAKRQETGKTWARPRIEYNYEKCEYEPLPKGCNDDILTFENNPCEGFKIVGSVSRWSTSNKFIQVEDPRGFVVEIPTGNLTTLIKYVTVEKGVVKDECVWGREGSSNHILLPKSSEPYQKAFEQTELTNTKVSFTKLNKGDVVKFSADSKDNYTYLGRGKATWKVETKQAERVKGYGPNLGNYRNSEFDKVIETTSVEDTKLCFIFKCENEDSTNNLSYDYKLSGKAIVVGSKELTEDEIMFDTYIPERCKEDIQGNYRDHGKYQSAKVIKITMK